MASSKIGGREHKVPFEIDTGSDRCIISKGEAMRLGVEPKHFLKPKSIVGVGGEQIDCGSYCVFVCRPLLYFCICHFMIYRVF